MYLRTVLILILMALVVVFAALNWSAFVTPTALSVGFGTVEAPLGLILLAIVAVLAVLFLVYVAYLQSTVILESRRHARELQGQRELAEQAEASRFNQLQAVLQAELQKLAVQTDQSRTTLLTRLEQVDRDLRAALEQTANSLAAYIGELEDRFDTSQNKPT